MTAWIRSLRGGGQRWDGFLLRAAEYFILLYVFFLFLDKGEGLRNVGLYGALASWVAYSVRRGRVQLPNGPLAWAFWGFAASCLISAVFSIKPAFSIKALKDDVLPACILFITIGGMFDRSMLLRIGKVMAASGALLLALGLHGFLTGPDGFYTSQSVLLSADKNKYGYYVGYIFPFFLLLILDARGAWRKASWGALASWAAVAVVLSASRASIANILSASVIYAAMRLKRGLVVAAVALLVLAFAFEAALPYMPANVRQHFEGFWEQVGTYNMRTSSFWEPVLASVKKRPISGWGYGSEVYRDPRPFEGTTQPEWWLKGGLHSTYFSVLFHQGVIGLLAYIFLIAAMAILLARRSRPTGAPGSLPAVALLAMTVGTFMVHGALHVVYLRMMGLTAGMAAALLRWDAQQPGSDEG